LKPTSTLTGACFLLLLLLLLLLLAPHTADASCISCQRLLSLTGSALLLLLLALRRKLPLLRRKLPAGVPLPLLLLLRKDVLSANAAQASLLPRVCSSTPPPVPLPPPALPLLWPELFRVQPPSAAAAAAAVAAASFWCCRSRTVDCRRARSTTRVW
jgi:hypothetical protein